MVFGNACTLEWDGRYTLDETVEGADCNSTGDGNIDDDTKNNSTGDGKKYNKPPDSESSASSKYHHFPTRLMKNCFRTFLLIVHAVVHFSTFAAQLQRLGLNIHSAILILNLLLITF